jgi:alkaline phosphatase D
MRRHVTLALSLLLASPALAATITGGPLVGATDDTTARLWVRADGPCQVAVRYRTGSEAWRATAAVPARPELDFTAELLLEGLAPETEYAYEITVDGAPLGRGPWAFRTLPRPGQGRVTIAFGSCVHLGRFPEQPIFGAIAAARPSAFVWLGDDWYYDNSEVGDATALWARCRAQRECPSLLPMIATTPSFAQWDDHDYGPNDSDHTFANKALTRTIFRAYFPGTGEGEEGQGIYGRASLGPVDLFLLDDRTFREPPSTPNSPTKTLLGERQRRWLIEGLAASRAPLKLVATGSQFLARYHSFESWQHARDERDLILDAIRDRQVKGVVFVSGDRHLAEVVRYPADRVGYELWDLTSSPLANRTFERGAAVPNPDRVFVHATGNNYGWLEVDAARGYVRFELRDEEGKTLWSHEPAGLLAPAAPARRFF